MNADPDPRAAADQTDAGSGSSSDKVRDRAMFVLAQSGSPEARQVLVAHGERSNADPDVQARAIRYLGLFGGNESRQALVDIYVDQPEHAGAQGRAECADARRRPRAARGESRARRPRPSCGVKPSISSACRARATSSGSSISRRRAAEVRRGRDQRPVRRRGRRPADGSSRRRKRTPSFGATPSRSSGLTGHEDGADAEEDLRDRDGPGVKRAVLHAFFVQGNADGADRDRAPGAGPRR